MSRAMTAFVLLAVVVFAGVGAYAVFSPTSNRNLTFMLDFQPSTYHGIFYYGLDHGVYSSRGLNVSILPSSGSVYSIAAVSAGRVDFALADSGTLTLAAANSNVTNVRIVAMIFQVTPYSIIYNKARISTISDLDNKTMSAVQGSGPVKLFPVLASINHLDMNSIHVVYTDPSIYASLVPLGRADFVLSVVSRFPDLQILAAQNNINLGQFRYADYGLDLYGAAIMTSTEMIENHPDLVRNFVSAALESVQQASLHPADGIASLLKVAPQLNSTLALADFRAVAVYSLPLNINSTTNALSLGWIDPQKMQHTVNVLLQGYGINKTLDATSLYTDEFVTSP